MAQIYVKPTDTTASDYLVRLALFEKRVMSVRRFVSPDLTNPLTLAQLPDDVITDPIYVEPAESKVLSDLGLTTFDLNSPEIEKQVVLIGIQIAIFSIPQIQQIIRESTLGDSTQYSELNVKDRIEFLNIRYGDQLEEATPEGIITSGVFRILRTRKRSV